MHFLVCQTGLFCRLAEFKFNFLIFFRLEVTIPKKIFQWEARNPRTRFKFIPGWMLHLERWLISYVCKPELRIIIHHFYLLSSLTRIHRFHVCDIDCYCLQVKEVSPAARRRDAKLSFAVVYPDKNGRMQVKKVYSKYPKPDHHNSLSLLPDFPFLNLDQSAQSGTVVIFS